MAKDKSILDAVDSQLKTQARMKEQAKNDAKVGLTVEANKDGQTVTSVSYSIRTLDEALEAAKVDASVWDVERYAINKWDGFNKDVEREVVWSHGKATGRMTQHARPIVTPLWQVKVWLKRKQPEVVATESLIERLKSSSPFIKSAQRKPPRGKLRRSLEVSITDPHVGLVTHYPEGDGPQDLESAGATILAAMDDLIEKAAPFGPFEEVFMPFGNDFVHADTVFHTTTAGTPQPEMESWSRVVLYAELVAIEMVNRLRKIAPVYVYEVPGNHSRMTDFMLSRIVKATFHADPNVHVDASSSPYKFHRYGKTLIGFEHGHSIPAIRLASLMANERPKDWQETEYREWHLGDQHRKGSSKPSTLEEQGVSVEYLPGLTVPNEWHRIKSFNHQKRGAMAFAYDFTGGPIARIQHNISPYTHQPMRSTK